MHSSKLFSQLLLVTSLFTLMACNSPTASPPPVSQLPITGGRSTIVIGEISDDPSEVINGDQLLANYLASQLAEYGITTGEVKVVGTTDEMKQLLSNGEVDLYFDSVYPATIVSDTTGAQIILRRWRFGTEKYQSVIFANVETGITSIEQLPGYMVAMDAPYSTSGFLLPGAFLTERGLNLIGKRSYNEPVAANEVGFAFTYDDTNTIQWVLGGLAAAGVTDNYYFDVALAPDARQKLVELARTESIPRQVVLVRPGMEPALLNAIKQILIGMDENEAGKAALEPFQTSQFDEFPEGIESATKRMREMMEIVRGIPLP